MKIMRNQKGFTLVELLIGMVIMTIVLGGVYSIFNTSVKAFQYSQKRVYEEQQAREGMSAIIRDLKNASTIDIPSQGGSQVNYTIRTEENGQQNDQAFAIKLSNGTILRNTSPINPNSGNIVTGLSFMQEQNNDRRIITIIITLNDSENKASGELELKTKVFAPNVAK